MAVVRSTIPAGTWWRSNSNCAGAFSPDVDPGPPFGVLGPPFDPPGPPLDSPGPPFAFDHRMPGAANGDGVVDIADTLEITANFGLVGATFFQGDLNGDSIVDVGDTLEVVANFGNTLPLAAAAPAPEPSTLSLLAAAGAVGIAC